MKGWNSLKILHKREYISYRRLSTKRSDGMKDLQKAWRVERKVFREL